jgi:hypothetical protein
MFYLPNIDSSNNGISSPPELTLTGCTFKNIFFGYFSMILLQNSGKVTIESSTFTHISNVGVIISDNFNTHFTRTTESTYLAEQV